MQINSKTGLIENIPYTASPNTDERPAGTEIDLVVIHSISLPPGEYGGPWIEKLFSNQLPADAHPYFKEIHQLKVSAHVLIRRDGSVQQFVPFHQRAWHAGQSCYQGRDDCNNFSIGIELEGTDDSEFEDIQYQQLAELIDALQSSYPGINKNRLTGHSNIAPGRKTDPGSGFDWGRLRTLLA
ncbi:MAG: 1,6-anhydro-N-acetylmuramyl-L-alanine amidase AmpD [Gammaproteobacteria bacterium]|nr:1,6-anhydro-N-acetylmuramyl-L-alanine amidase AmpD [Gammaproteobacteria bacterium]MCW8922203.1 1,6-anhydro-N-acetylmuramyl-L-alanine amidase AmpD [Gammaproteobacteria bacterium]